MIFRSSRNLQDGGFLISTFASNSNFNIHTPGRRLADVFKMRRTRWLFSILNLTATIRESTLCEIRHSFFAKNKTKKLEPSIARND